MNQNYIHVHVCINFIHVLIGYFFFYSESIFSLSFAVHGKFISDEKNSSKMLHGFSLQLTFIIQLIIQTWSR